MKKIRKHDYGYGKELEARELNKITLKNEKELKSYLRELLKLHFNVRKFTIKIIDAKIKLNIIKL